MPAVPRFSERPFAGRALHLEYYQHYLRPNAVCFLFFPPNGEVSHKECRDTACVCHCLQQVPSNETTATREPPSSRPPEMLAQSDSNQNFGKRAGVLHCLWQLRSSIHHCNGKFTQIFKASHPHKSLQIVMQHRAYKEILFMARQHTASFQGWMCEVHSFTLHAACLVTTYQQTVGRINTSQ